MTSQETVDTCIVVPCFNEERRLRPADFLKGLDHLPSVTLLFVDDGSTDGTRDVLRSVCAATNRAAWLELPAHTGKAEAVRRGMVAALTRRDTRFVGYWDADLAAPLHEITRLRSVLLRRDDVDVVLGVRLRLLGHAVCQHSLRFLLGRVFAAAASAVLHHQFRDTQCGAKLFRATSRLREAVATPFRSRWIFDVELLRRCRTTGSPANAYAAIYEHPLEAWTSQADSKLTPWHYAWSGVELLGLWWESNRTRDARGGTGHARPASTDASGDGRTGSGAT